jgi:membrane-bound lytic murein transglycosylase A
MTASAFSPVSALNARDRGDVFIAPIKFSDLAGFECDDHLEAFGIFLLSCAAIAGKLPPLRTATPASGPLQAIAQKALRLTLRNGTEARRFFETNFTPCRISGHSAEASEDGFLTGYYEPIVDGSLTRTREFTAPLLGRPDNLNAITPYYERAAIESGANDGGTLPLVWLRDRVEVFLVQVQGSAKVRLADGRLLRLVYAGRNGHPYTSIGRILITSGEIAESAMSLAALKQWIRAKGQNPGDVGLALMHRNKSYVFFSLHEDVRSCSGPTGGQGIGLSALRSIAVDRTIWSYGLPFWLSANLPWYSSLPSPFRRLMIAQDTGSAITGPARCDIFFGSGDDAGARAGDIRHKAAFCVLLPVTRVRIRERKFPFSNQASTPAAECGRA